MPTTSPGTCARLPRTLHHRSWTVTKRNAASGEMITASGTRSSAPGLTDPAERRTRDESLRAVFADPENTAHESIAEAELDIDYAGSPIVMGDKHEALAPGQRLPDTIDVHLQRRGLSATRIDSPRRTYGLVIGGIAHTATSSHDLNTGYTHALETPRTESLKRPSYSRPGPTTESVRMAYARRSRSVGDRRGHATRHSARRTCRPSGRPQSIEALAAYHALLVSGRTIRRPKLQ